MCVGPVQIRHPDFNKVLDTHAMWTLDITGAETSVTVKTSMETFHGMTTVVENLKIAGLLGKPK